LYNLFLLLVLRERIYLEYVIFVGIHICFQLFLTGYAQFLFPDLPFLYERGVYIVGVLSGLSLFQFSRSYLRTAQETPKIDKVIQGYMGVSVVVLVLECFLSIRITASLNVLTVFLGSMLLFVLGFVRLFGGFKSARYFLVGQGAVLISVMFTALSSKHVINGFEMAPYLMKVASIVELLFFSIGLADRINRFKLTEVKLHQEAAKANAESNARKLYIDQINEINQALESALKSRSEFLANMSHEIRTPMNGILGMLELIDDKKLDELERNYIETARRSGKTLLELINEILDLSKIEADKLELESEPVFLQELLSDLQHLYSHQLKERGIALNIKWDRRLPVGIMGDRTRLWQILTNLTSNGIKFTHDGAVTLAMEKCAESHVRVSVSDTGIGIPEDKQAQIFESFTQADGSTTRQYGGTGLGLTISRKLIEKMGGELKVTSELGKGSTFHFTMPYVAADNLEQPAAEVCQSTAVDGCFGELKVLVVEDNIVNQKVAQGMLRKIGIGDVHVCENGVDAIVAIDRERFDVVLMDVQMPLMDGYETTRKLREQEQLVQREPQLIIAMTANSMEGDRKRCLDAGMNDYVAKPIQTDALKNVLLRNLKTSSDNAAINRTNTKSA
ncbi:MAG: ATP-binding protein, partial [Pseudomonadales bacterium]|nr:ATP-binding protein [Pseudomonadales bacterium]